MLGLKKKPWIGQAGIDFLMSLDPLFIIYYEVDVGGNTVKMKFRDDSGMFIADTNRSDVTAIILDHLPYISVIRYPLLTGNRLQESDIPTLKKQIDQVLEILPTTKSTLSLADLRQEQKHLHDEIEKTVNVYGWRNPEGSKSNNICILLNSLNPASRFRLVDFLSRLDGSSVKVHIAVDIDSAMDEEIGATLNELALYEQEQQVKS